MQLGTVYVLRHPSTGDVVYVGSTICSLGKRLGQHMSASKTKCGGYRLKRWLRGMSGMPRIDPIVLNVPRSELERLEAAAILDFIDDGVPLLNQRLPTGHRKPSAARRTRGEMARGA